MVELEFSVIGLEALREKLEDAGDRYKLAYAAALNDLSPQNHHARSSDVCLFEQEKCGGAFASLAPLTGFQLPYRNIIEIS